MNIVLCGMMGCGKTTVAAELGKSGYSVVDTDAVIVERYGEINKIFDNRGEEYFRDIESLVTAQVAKNYGNAVISLGGGCVLRAQNVKNLKDSGKIFYLRASAQTIIGRLEGDTARPLLRGGLEERVTGLLKARASVYEDAADFIVDTDGKTPEQIAREIVRLTEGGK